MAGAAVRVVVDRLVLERFKRSALKAYPKETISGLWGRKTADEYRVFCIVPLKTYAASRTSVEYEPPAEEEKDRWDYLGTIHSHPVASLVPSDTDWQSFNDTPDESLPEQILGIMGVSLRAGRRFTSFAFYSHSEQLELVIGEGKCRRGKLSSSREPAEHRISTDTTYCPKKH